MRLLVLSSFAVLLLASTPTASACHPPPQDIEPLCDDWENPPFGIVPHAGSCLDGTEELARVLCEYAESTTLEILFGCPPTGGGTCTIQY